MSENWLPNELSSEIRETAAAMIAASEAYNQARSYADSHKSLALLPAQDLVDAAKSIAAMDGMVSGATAGKNAAERDLKLDKVLREDKEYQETLSTLAKVKAEQSRLECVAETAEQEYKALYHKLGALQSASALMVAEIERQTVQDNWMHAEANRQRMEAEMRQVTIAANFPEEG